MLTKINSILDFIWRGLAPLIELADHVLGAELLRNQHCSWSFITVWITRVIWWHQWWPQWPREGWRRAARQHACSRTFSKWYFQAFLLLYFSSNYHLYFLRNISWRGCFKMTKLALMHRFSFPCNILKSPNILNWQVFFLDSWSFWQFKAITKLSYQAAHTTTSSQRPFHFFGVKFPSFLIS